MRGMLRFPWLVWFSLAICLGTCVSVAAGGEDNTISLAGPWRFKLDPEHVGQTEKWDQKQLQPAGTLKLPGSLTENSVGDDISVETKWTGQIVDQSWYTAKQYERYRQPGNVKVPFWLNPVKHYVGPAWYQRDITIPDGWRGKRITLFLERAHWETQVWVDGRSAGVQNSLSTPHVYDLDDLAPGKHRLTVCVDNRVKIDVGVNAHSVTDHTQTNWNGLVGRMELRASDPVWIKDIQVFPDVGAKKARVRVTVGNATGQPVEGRLSLEARSCNSPKSHQAAQKEEKLTVADKESSIEVEYPMGDDVQLWDEFSPALYTMTASLNAAVGGRRLGDRSSVTFGMREFKANGTQFALNGRPVFLRGTLECCIFPLTGYAPTDLESWTRILKVARAHGLNHLRFHSWCPPEAAFAAADRMGFMYQIECAVWTSVGVNESTDAFIQAETERILRAYGNHPSFCLLSHGNEPGGNQAKFLPAWVSRWKAADPRRLYTAGSGWPSIPENQYHVTPAPRIQAWGGGLNSRVNAKPPETVTDYRDFVEKNPGTPIISHEIGQWCVYPNLEEITKYTGVTRARNFEIFRDTLKANHLLDQARDFLMASGKLQTLLYKEEIESALRTRGFGGLELLDLHDFPGQGTALVGVLDPFWDSKGYVTPEEYHRFACETVPLARMSKRIWTSGETFVARVEIAHFGPGPIKDAAPVWTIAGQDGKAIAQGRLPSRTIPVGNGTALGEVKLDLSRVKAPQKLVLAVALEGTAYSNDWDFWVYLQRVDTTPPAGILIVDELDAKAMEALKAGGKVMLMPGPGTVKGDQYGKVPPGFSSIFWNTAWTARQAPHTLGILCDPKHPALAAFPTEYHSNWQWWDLVSTSQIMILNELPPKLRPIVQVIDDWFTNRRLGLVFEANVEGGKLLVCSVDLRSRLEARPVARQMLHSLLSYLGSDAFQPQIAVDAKLIRDLRSPPPEVKKLGAKLIKVDRCLAMERDQVDNPNGVVATPATASGTR